MVAVSRRKGTLRSLVAKLLVLGDKQTGKSASIVRYTTGRFIEHYSDLTSDWLYRHSLGFDAKRNVSTLVELIEQEDLEIFNSSKFFANSTSNLNQIESNNNNSSRQQHSLSSRVALDLQVQSKQQLMNKLNWANAYIVIYAINDINSFNKAIKYLNFIANNINSPLDAKTSCCSTNASSNNNNNNNSSTGFLNRFSPGGTLGGSPNLASSRQSSPMVTTAGSACGQSNCSSSVGSGSSGSNSCACPIGGGSNFNLSANNSSLSSSLEINNNNNNNNNNNHNIKRPILLLGNKRDLEKSGRQVNAHDGRLLAMRHQSMFAEVSIAESSKLIELVLANLIDQIDPACLQVEHLSPQRLANLQPIVRWSPTIELPLGQKHCSPSPLQATQSNSTSSSPPIWASLVKSHVPIGSAVIQSNRRLETATADVRSVRRPALSSTSSVASIGRPLVDHLSATTAPVAAAAAAAKTTTLKVTGPRRLISCSKELIKAPDQANHYQMATGAAGSAVASASSFKGLQTCHKLAVLTSNMSKYQNLKTSFRRASMAIFGSKTLAKGASKGNNTVTSSVSSSGSGSGSGISSCSSSISSISISSSTVGAVPKGQRFKCETIGDLHFVNSTNSRAPFKKEKQFTSTRDSIGECTDLIDSPDQHHRHESNTSLARGTPDLGANWLRKHASLGDHADQAAC